MFRYLQKVCAFIKRYLCKLFCNKNAVKTKRSKEVLSRAQLFTTDVQVDKIMQGPSREYYPEEYGAPGGYDTPRRDKTPDFATLSVFHEGRKPEPLPDPWEILVDDRDPAGARDLYNIWAKSYDDYMRTDKYNGPSIAAHYLSSRLRVEKMADILDLGSGTGLSGVELHTLQGYQGVDAVDISEEMMKLAKRKGCYENHFMENVTPDARLNFRGVFYDAVVMVASLMPGHISPRSINNISAKLVKPTGYLLIVGPTLAEMAEKSEEFSEEYFRTVLEHAKTTCGMDLIERQIVPDFFKSKPGEMIVFQRRG